jgi:hypothetical protein
MLLAGALLVDTFAAAAVHAQVSSSMQGTTRDDAEKARLLGVLTFTRVTVTFDETPVRDALKTLGALLHITIIGRFSSATDLRGIDPEMPVSIQADQRFAVDILEEMLEQCAMDEPLTWQLRLAMVEVGTKQRLSSSASRETRTYNLTDLLIEPPNFGGSGGAKYEPVRTPYVDALLGAANRASVRAGGQPGRKSKTELMLELVEGMIEFIEPGHWDLGGDSSRDAEPDNAADPEHSSPSHTVPATRPASPSRKESMTRRQGNPEHWASMRAWQEGLIITAPDFMHRELGGYPKPIPPEITSVTAPPIDHVSPVPAPKK